MALAACGDAPRESAPDAATPPPAGTPYVVADTTLAATFDAAGVAEPMQRTVMATKLMTRVTSVLVQEGDRVTAGQVLADSTRGNSRPGESGSRPDSRPPRPRGAMPSRARTGCGRSTPTARRRRRSSIRPRRRWRGRRPGCARRGRREPSWTPSATTRRFARPYAGVVTQRLIEPGALAAPGQPLLVVEDQSRLRIAVTAAPDAVRGVRPGPGPAGHGGGQSGRRRSSRAWCRRLADTW